MFCTGKIWSCHVCTLENPISNLFCGACNEGRPSKEKKPARPPPPKSKSETDKKCELIRKLQRQTSNKVEAIREDDETKALKEWKNIVSICTEVSTMKLIQFIDLLREACLCAKSH